MTSEQQRPVDANGAVGVDGSGSTSALAAERSIDFGQRLKQYREQSGMSVPALSQVTRITYSFIESLEAGAFDKLPGNVFARGFVRAIARATHQDAELLVKEFDEIVNMRAAKAETRSVLTVEIKNKPQIEESSVLAHAVAKANEIAAKFGKIPKSAPVTLAVAFGLYVGLTSQPVRNALKNGFKATSTASLTAPAKKQHRPLDLPTTAEQAVQPAAVDEVAGSPSSEETKKLAVDGTSDHASNHASKGKAPNDEVGAGSTPAPAKSAGDTQAKSSETADKSEATSLASQDSVQNAAENPANGQSLEFVVTDRVRVRLTVDGGQMVTKELTPDTYKFGFKDRADVMVYDAAAVKINFNGRALGSLGSKGRVRRLSFEAATPPPDKL